MRLTLALFSFQWPQIPLRKNKMGSNEVNQVRLLAYNTCNKLFEAKSRKIQGVFKLKSRVKTWQVRKIWSQQLEQKQVQKRGAETGVRKGKRFLLAWHTRCKCSMVTTHILVKVKLGINVMKIGGKSHRLRSQMSFNIRERDTSYCPIGSQYRP